MASPLNSAVGLKKFTGYGGLPYRRIQWRLIEIWCELGKGSEIWGGLGDFAGNNGEAIEFGEA